MSLSLSTLCKSIFYLLSFLNCLLYTSNSILSLLLFYCLLYTSNSIFSILLFTVYCLLNSISTSISSPPLSLSLFLSFPLRLHLSLVFPHLTPSLLAQGSELNGLLFTNKHRSRKAPSQLSLPPALYVQKIAPKNSFSVVLLVAVVAAPSSSSASSSSSWLACVAAEAR